MMCQSTGMPPISSMGLGLYWLSSEIRVPYPPARITTFISLRLSFSFLFQSKLIIKTIIYYTVFLLFSQSSVHGKDAFKDLFAVLAMCREVC